MRKPDIMTTAIRVSATSHFTAPRIYTRALLLYKKSQDNATPIGIFLGFFCIIGFRFLILQNLSFVLILLIF